LVRALATSVGPLRRASLLSLSDRDTLAASIGRVEHLLAVIEHNEVAAVGGNLEAVPLPRDDLRLGGLGDVD